MSIQRPEHLTVFGAQRTHNPDNYIPILHLLFSLIHCIFCFIFIFPHLLCSRRCNFPVLKLSPPRAQPCGYVHSPEGRPTSSRRPSLLPHTFSLLLHCFSSRFSADNFSNHSYSTIIQRPTDLCLLEQSHGLLPPEASGHGCETSAE